MRWLDELISAIKRENGIPDDVQCIVCTACRKPVQHTDGFMHCDCHDERKGIDPNHPAVVPIVIEEESLQ